MVFTFLINNIYLFFVLLIIINIFIIFYFLNFNLNFFILILYIFLQEVFNFFILINIWVWIFIIIKFIISPFYFWYFYIIKFLKKEIFNWIIFIKKLTFFNLIMLFFRKIFIYVIFGIFLISLNIYNLKNEINIFLIINIESFNWLLINNFFFTINFLFFIFFYIIIFILFLRKINEKILKNFELNYFLISLPFRLRFFLKIFIFRKNIFFNNIINLIIIYFLLINIIRIFNNFKIIFFKVNKKNLLINRLIIFLRFIFIL